MSERSAAGEPAPGGKDVAGPRSDASTIQVKATLACSSCGYKKSFKNRFDRKSLDMLVVSAKVLAWTACDCGELIEFSLEFDI